MKITRVAVVDGKALVYIDTVPDIPIIVSEGQEVYFSTEFDGHSVETLWFRDPSAEKNLPLARVHNPSS